MSNPGDGDKRSVTTDALETLGQFISEREKRDAIHLAVEPVTAGAELNPGQHITVKNGVAYPADRGQGLGIVDPFLPTYVRSGQRFWFVMYPRMVHSLRHVWTHPAFVDEPEKQVLLQPAVDDRMERARARIQAAANEMGLDCDEIIDGARNYQKYGDYMVDGGRWEGESLSDPATFWDAYQTVTGEEVPPDNRESFFSCSC